MIIFLWICIYLSGSVCAAFLWREVIHIHRKLHNSELDAFDIWVLIASIGLSWVSCGLMGIRILCEYLQNKSYLINWANKNK